MHLVVSLRKRWLLGTHQGAVSATHLDFSLDEFTFRFNRRTSRHRGQLCSFASLSMINFVNLLTIYFVNSWLPSMLRTMGAATESAIIATSMFHVGAIVSAFITGAAVTRYGIEPVLRLMLAFGGACILRQECSI